MHPMDRMLDATAHAEPRHFWFRGLRRYARTLIGRRLSPGARILDAGCGTGYNLGWLARYGGAVGVDLSPKALAFAAAGRRPVARASVTRLPFADDTFDLVTSFDVIYSLGDDDEAAALAEMWRVVRPGGFVLVNAAALDSLRGSHSVLTREVRRYTRARLRARLERAGFRVTRLTATNASTLPIALAVRWRQRRRGAETHVSVREFEPPPGPVNAALAGLLAAEAWLIGRGLDLPVGSSVMALAEKPRVATAG
jgi:SAM-dependent methyltransferase